MPPRFEITNGKIGTTEQAFKGKVLNDNIFSENIIVIGTQQYNHNFLGYVKAGLDAGVNGKFMFIHQAMRKVKQNTELDWTVIIYKEGYTEAQITAMQVAILGYYPPNVEINFVTIYRNEQLVNYINTGDANSSGNTEARKEFKIRRIHFFCHGLVHRLAIGITNLSNTDAMLDITHQQVKQMKKESFSKDLKIYCWACRTGLGNDKINKSVFFEEKVSTGWFSSKAISKRYDILPEKSLAQTFADVTGGRVMAFLVRSEYSSTLNSPDELDFKDAFRAGTKGTKRERPNPKYDYLLDSKKITQTDWDRYKILQNEDEKRRTIDGGKFDPQGARYPVTGGTSPEGLTRDMQTYIKMKK
jgi:hypothetical protein